MITFNVLAFLSIVAGSVGFGAAVAVHIYGVNNEEADRVRRFMRDVDVCDEASNGEFR